LIFGLLTAGASSTEAVIVLDVGVIGILLKRLLVVSC
jgi:hypothetical protein